MPVYDLRGSAAVKRTDDKPCQSEALGRFMLICREAEAYQDWPIGSCIRLFVPPIDLGQYAIFTDGDATVGFLTWAWFSNEVSDWIMAHHDDPRPFEWNSGDILWLVDLVCLDGYAPKVARCAQRQIFPKSGLPANRQIDHAFALRRIDSGDVRKSARFPLTN